MRKYILTSFIVFAFIAAQAQKERNVWCFGTSAGLDFNSGSPVVLTNTAISTTEGCSSIADTSGKLLFYTDGITVWNKNNIAMPNGSGLGGGGSSTQSALIVRQPGSYTTYYIFTTAEAQGANGFEYSTVDMTLQSGLGDVVVKNTQVQTNMTEKVCGVYDANGTDVWIMVHPLSSDGFYAYKFTGSGFNLTPVISNIGTAMGNASGDEIGYMKFSPDGKKLVCAVRYQYYYELFDFDNSTGVLSNPIHFSSNGNRCYGVEFSPDNSKLYFTGDDYLWQADLSSNDSALIAASVQVIISSDAEWAIQLAPDGKIYMAMFTNTLSVINNPNALGAACGFSLNAINLGSAYSNLGLPDMMANSVSSSPPPPVAALQSTDSSLCADDCIGFKDLSTNNPTSWLWTFQGGLPATSTDQNPPTVCYLSAGSYDVTLTVSNNGGNNTITLNSFINVVTAPPQPGITQFDSLLYCHSDTAYISYQWYDDTTLIPGATDTFLIVNNIGQYNLGVTNSNGCSIAVGINIVLGIAENGYNNSFYLYPNPAGNKLCIKNGELKIKMISIYNVLGESCINSIVESSNPEIDISSLSKGVYFAEIRSEQGMNVRKFVKE